MSGEATPSGQATADLFNAAVEHHHARRLEEAVSLYRQVLAQDPSHANAHGNLGAALRGLGRLDEAVAAYRRSLEILPHSAAVQNNLGNVLTQLRRYPEAEAAFREAVRIAPDYAGAYANLGGMLHAAGRAQDAAWAYRQVLRIEPNNSQAHFDLGSMLQEIGGADDEAKASYRRAIDTGPPSPVTFSNLLFSQQLLSNYTPAELRADAEAFGRMARGMARAPYQAWRCEPDPRRLRVGFVSGDLRDHVGGYFVESVMQAMDAARIEMIAYPTQGQDGQLTGRIRPCFSAWRPIHGLNDEAAARLIHDDALHVLVDLSGHTAHNRMGLFAWKPAPVQATWIGYFGTTGVAEIDYFLTDRHVLPPEDESHFVETPWRLGSAGCLTPPAVDIAPNALPALERGVFTFGCFNNLRKVTDEVVALWSRILLQAPGARLFLKAPQLGRPDIVEKTRQRFAAHGVSPDRLLLEAASPRDLYFQAYHRIDVALDPFPYNGATTSIEGLWMGVPAIVRPGDRFLSRVGESIAHRAGMAEWIATDDDDYVAKAVALAADPTPLVSLRATLREKVLASPLFDAGHAAKDLEDALWGMWRRTGVERVAR
jgi:predicted O-linked N-acetylglucosamine transferase (SPINDLY family)